MRRLSFLILNLLFYSLAFAQSPHTDALIIDCAKCHNSTDWGVNPTQVKFDHSTTNFSLIGQHLSTDCKSCHTTLVFNQVSSQCFSCHEDIHQNTVGLDCQRCHSSNSWVVTEINQIHDESRFPLVGVHLNADCIQCHSGYQNLYFEQLSIACVSCHQEDYNSTTSPNHAAAGFQTECQDCHSIASNSWSAEHFDHGFFPLIGGHNIANCFACHQQGGNFSGLSAECYSCHREDYEQVLDPNHLAGNYPIDCTICHSINQWSPADFNHSNTRFPLTGAHKDVDCRNCHSQTYTGTPTACVECHRDNYDAVLSPNHKAIGISTECETCHSTIAWVPSSFSHTSTGFELLGQHAIVNCESCHEGTTSGLSHECISCHQQDFDASLNPNHNAIAIPTDCQTCHTPSENWEPASFPIHNNYYELVGAHATIANDCITCHNNNYNNTPNTCFGCHETAYNGTTNPAHASAGFSTECESCHGQNAWIPSTFDHDNQYFPIYSGRHRAQWNSCSDCHINASNFSVFSCIDCHQHNQQDTDGHHQGINGYLYNSEACYSCHPIGEAVGAFNHATSNFPLTGAHISVDCIQCHQEGYSGTSVACISCHQSNYNEATNPDHQALSISTDCSSCHSTAEGWEPATFSIHNNYYELVGAHATIANDCITCHNNNYNSTPNTCFGCHETAYNGTTNPAHASAGFSTECESCHSQNAWIPSTFDHDNQYFPIYSGRHRAQWNSCSDCHINASNFSVFSCIDCHEHNQQETDGHHNSVAGYVYNSQACYDCHPSGDGIGNSKNFKNFRQ